METHKIRPDYLDAYHQGGGFYYPVIIYQIINVENGKRWVGETFNLDVSKFGQLFLLKKQQHPSKEFIEDYNLYGDKVFHFSILEIIKDIEEVREKFNFYINLLKPEYNLQNKFKLIE